MSEQWPLTKLGDVISLEYGKPLPKGDRDPEGAFPVYGANGEKARSNKFYHSTPTIVVGRKGSAGELNLTEGKFWPLDVTYFVTFDEEKYEMKYLYYLLQTLNLPSMAKGVKPGINRNDVYAIEVRIPPKEEQQRIVSIIDEAFNKLAEKSERIQQQILSIDNLFDGVLDSEYANQSEWNMGALDEIIESTFYGPRFAKDAYTPDGVVSLRTTDMADDGLFEFKDPPRIPLDAKQLEKYRLIDGDILIARSGSVGKCAIYTEDLGEAMPSAYLIRMRLKKGLVHPRFVLRYLLSRTGQRHLIGHSTSSTMANINSKNLRNIPFSFPSLAEQMRIIEKLDGLYYESKTLKQTYHSGLNNLVELKQSILQEAFSGKLTGGIIA